ncbi:MAG: hypothetical protein H0W20_03045 [Chthoniobacterales bacterium]|nr:hypothetical protein [Chthoniobacterales bacterium]
MQSTTPPKRAEYKKTRLVAYFAAGAAIALSTIAGIIVFEASRGPQSGAFGAAGQVAAVIPGFAGVLLAAFALSAYMREEDEILKLAEAAWLGRNRFLFCSQYLYYSVDSDMGQSSDDFSNLVGVKESLISLLPEFKSSLLNTELSRSLAQKEMEAGGDGSRTIFAVRGFFEEVHFFISSEDAALALFRDKEAEEAELVNQRGDWTPKEILDGHMHALVRHWTELAERVEGLDTVEAFETLLRENYKHSLKDNLHKLVQQHNIQRL